MNSEVMTTPAAALDANQDDRATLDVLFAQRAATHGAMGVEAHQKIRETVEIGERSRRPFELHRSAQGR